MCGGVMEKGSGVRMRRGAAGWEPTRRCGELAAGRARQHLLYQRPYLAGGWEKLSRVAVVWRRARG